MFDSASELILNLSHPFKGRITFDRDIMCSILQPGNY